MTKLNEIDAIVKFLLKSYNTLFFLKQLNNTNIKNSQNVSDIANSKECFCISEANKTLSSVRARNCVFFVLSKLHIINIHCCK